MNPLPPWHHGFFKNRIAFGQRRRQGNHVLHVHALSGKQHDFMAQACGFEAVVRYQHTRHALPLDFFHQHGDQNIAQIAVQTDERLVQQGKVAAAQQQAQGYHWYAVFDAHPVSLRYSRISRMASGSFRTTSSGVTL